MASELIVNGIEGGVIGALLVLVMSFFVGARRETKVAYTLRIGDIEATAPTGYEVKLLVEYAKAFKRTNAL